MRAFNVYFRDPVSGEEHPVDMMPRIGEIVVQRRFSAIDPNKLYIIVEPIDEYLRKNRSEKVDGHSDRCTGHIHSPYDCGAETRAAAAEASDATY